MFDLPSSVVGLMSFIIVTLGGVVARLYYQNTSLYKQIIDIQNERVVESQETRDKVAIPLQQIAQYSELTYRKLTDGNK